MRVWAWTLWIQPEGTSVQSSGEGRGSPVFAIPSLWAELEPSLTELLGLASLTPAGGRPLRNCGSFWMSRPTQNPSLSPSTRWAPTGGDCEKIKHRDITQGSGWDPCKPHTLVPGNVASGDCQRKPLSH